MRIAIAAHSAAQAGGVERYLGTVVPALAQAGHEVACWFEGTVPDFEPVVSGPAPGPFWIAGPDYGPDVLEPLRRWRPDVIYLHGLRSPMLEAQLVGIAPVAFYAHSYYGACISGEKMTRLARPSACDRSFGPACLACYLPLRCGGFSPVTMAQQYAAQRHKQSLLGRYASVLVASRHMRREYARQGIEAVVVPLPLGDCARAERPGDRGTEEWTLLYLGRLERAKGVDVAVRASVIAAARASRPVRLTIAGQGSLGPAVKAQAEAAAARTERLTVDVRGWLTGSERDTALARADLLLVPSLWPEPFGLVGIEAAAAGVPAVAFGVGGIEDWLVDGVTGRVVPAGGDGRHARFAAAILSILQDPVTLGRMRTAAEVRARQFTMAAHLGALEPVLHATADAHGRRPRA